MGFQQFETYVIHHMQNFCVCVCARARICMYRASTGPAVPRSIEKKNPQSEECYANLSSKEKEKKKGKHSLTKAGASSQPQAQVHHTPCAPFSSGLPLSLSFSQTHNTTTTIMMEGREEKKRKVILNIVGWCLI